MNKEIKQYINPGKKNLIMLYILFLCGVVTSLLPIIGAVFAYINKDVEDETLASHYIFLFRTFWIGCVGTIICIIATIIMIGPILYICLIIWFILRVAIGFKYLLNDTAHPNYMSYWIK